MTAPQPNHAHYAKVLAWHDGDTIHLDVDRDYEDHGHTTHRLWGINAPELATDAGKASLAYAEAAAPAGTDLIIVSYQAKNQIPTDGSKEKYGRWLAEIWVAGEPDRPSINQQLVNAGLATPYYGGARVAGDPREATRYREFRLARDEHGDIITTTDADGTRRVQTVDITPQQPTGAPA